MKVYFIIPILIAATEGFSMLTPRFADFPRRFGKYLKELDEIFEPDWPSAFMEKQLEEFKDSSSMVFHRASPRYEVIEKPDSFEVKIDVPGFKPEEIEVGLKGGGRILTISGQHEQKEAGRSFSSKFQQNFSLDPSIQTDQMSADMIGTSLIVTAPRIDRLPESRKIPIQRIEAAPEEHEEKVEATKTKAVKAEQEDTVKP
jgi:HSP20 family protein